MERCIFSQPAKFTVWLTRTSTGSTSSIKLLVLPVHTPRS
jgi:hypothetical protein